MKASIATRLDLGLGINGAAILFSREAYAMMTKCSCRGIGAANWLPLSEGLWKSVTLKTCEEDEGESSELLNQVKPLLLSAGPCITSGGLK